MKNIIGAQGEILAQKFLKKNKYKIITTNFKNSLGEIDIVATKNDVLIFVEVKFRTSEKFGRPSEAVNAHKQNKIKQVATSFITKHNMFNVPVRFDVIEIIDSKINHIENAF